MDRYVNNFLCLFRFILNKIKLISIKFKFNRKMIVNKIVLSFVVFCVTFCYFFSSSHVYADVGPDYAPEYVTTKFMDESLGDVPGNVVWQFSDEFFKLDKDTQLSIFDKVMKISYWVHLYPFTDYTDNRENFWNYIFFSPYPFYFTDNVNSSNKAYFAFYEKNSDMKRSDNDVGYKNGSLGYISKWSRSTPTDFRSVNFGFSSNISNNEVSLQEILTQKADDPKDIYGGGIYSNFPLYYYGHDGTEQLLCDPLPDVGEGEWAISLKYDKEVFSDFECSLYPNEPITQGFYVNSGDEYTLSWKSKSSNCYIEYKNSKDEIIKVKPYRKDGKFHANFVKSEVGNVTYYFKEGTGEWYDVILDFIDSMFSGIYEFFRPVIDFFGGIFDFLWNLIVDVFTFIFVPENGFFEKFFNDSMDMINKKLGILMYPFVLIVDILGRFADIAVSSGVLHFPSITVPILDVKLFNGADFDLKGMITSNSTFSSLYNTYLAFVDVILIFALVNLARSKFSSVFKKGSIDE